MLNYENQLNLGNIYSDCKEMFKEQRPEFLELLDKYIDINLYIPFSFKNAFIPLNSRATSDKPNCPINENGIPLCPNDHSLHMLHGGMCHENGRADRIKWRCPKINMVNGKWICSCENPCTTAKLGRTTYTTPSKNLRLYPGTIRGTEE